MAINKKWASCRPSTALRAMIENKKLTKAKEKQNSFHLSKIEEPRGRLAVKGSIK